MLLGGAIMQASLAFPMAFTQNGPGPGFWPFSLGAGICLAALILLIHNAMNRFEIAAQAVSLTTPSNMRVYLLMGIIVVFCGLISLLGFYGAGLVLIPAVMLLMDFKDKKIIALTTVGTLGFIYIVFSMVLSTKLPESIFLR